MGEFAPIHQASPLDLPHFKTQYIRWIFWIFELAQSLLPAKLKKNHPLGLFFGDLRGPTPNS